MRGDGSLGQRTNAAQLAVLRQRERHVMPAAGGGLCRTRRGAGRGIPRAARVVRRGCGRLPAVRRAVSINTILHSFHQ